MTWKREGPRKTKILRVTDKGWNSQKELSGPVEKKKSRRRKLLYPHPKLSLGLVPYRPLLWSRCIM